MLVLFPLKKHSEKHSVYMMKSWFLRRTDKNAEEQVVPVHSCARQNTEEFANSHTVRVDTLRTAVGQTELCCPGTSGLVGGLLCVALSSSSVDSAALGFIISPEKQPFKPLCRFHMNNYSHTVFLIKQPGIFPPQSLCRYYPGRIYLAPLCAILSQLLALSGLLTHRPVGLLQMAQSAGQPSHMVGCTHV